MVLVLENELEKQVGQVKVSNFQPYHGLKNSEIFYLLVLVLVEFPTKRGKYLKKYIKRRRTTITT